MVYAVMPDGGVESVADGLSEGDAALISAAPDLLAACEAARQFIINGVEFGYIRMPYKGDPALDTLPKLNAAIAKARGE